MEITFPPAFLWGTATAAHQVEGGNVYNDNWVMEHVPGSSYVESSGDACLRDGLDVRGYTYWSALDNFEWKAGYRPTFGLIAVDRRRQERTVKPSARWLGRIAQVHGF
jgi:beta-glucosidase/6-phospho-beta-glucosidase/beta-galactosidase